MTRPVVNIDTPVAPPTWALLERQLLKAMSDACVQFFDHYFDDCGYLLCVPRWGGDDGPDDAVRLIERKGHLLLLLWRRRRLSEKAPVLRSRIPT